MKIESISIKNYGPYEDLNSVKLKSMTTIVGQNDVGKSYILKGLRVFLQEKKIDRSDIFNRAGSGDQVSIDVAFSSYPEEVEIESGVKTNFKDELLLDDHGYLHVRKIFDYDEPNQVKWKIVAVDYVDVPFHNLCTKKEKDLNDICASVGLDYSKSGRSITNKDKRKDIRELAAKSHRSTELLELEVESKSDLARLITGLLPNLVLFEAETRLDVDESSFQSEFKDIVKAAIDSNELNGMQEEFKKVMKRELQKEIDGIFEHLRKHTDSLTELIADPIVSLDKAVSFDILGGDSDGVVEPLSQRGSGLRRLLMVSAFQYLAQKGDEMSGKYIFAVEEPENCLHPKLQRDLSESFKTLSENGYQILITTHSPVFAGSADLEDIVLVSRSNGRSTSTQFPNLKALEIANELGIEPTDQITAFKACAFVEGKDDVYFWKTVAEKFKKSGKTDSDFDMNRIGLIITGGDNLKHWMSERAMAQLNRRYCVIVDSDKTSAKNNIPGKKLNWKSECEGQGGKFFILQKREIENYLHSNAIFQLCGSTKAFDDYTDMKAAFGDGVISALKYMTCEEILERDLYMLNGKEHHELLEIVRDVLDLSRSG